MSHSPKGGLLFTLFFAKLNKMSLGGKLEDLGLGEILSIVGLSRKSGVLFLTQRNEEGKIVFKYGQVIYAETPSSPDIIKVLLTHNILPPDKIEDMKREFELLFPSVRTFAEFLREHQGVKSRYLEKVLSPYIEEEVFRMFRWEEGRFNLEIVEDEKDLTLYMNPYGVSLEIGINPQFLAIEGSRRKDEEEKEAPQKKAENAMRMALKEEKLHKLKEAVPAAPLEREKGEYAELKRFAAELLSSIDIDLGKEEMEEVGEPEDIKRLKSYIYELHNPSSSAEITLLVLRYASEIMNRAVIFLVRKNEVVGLGQFGIYTPMPDSNALVRGIRIPLDAPSIFRDVIERSSPVKRALRKEGWDKFLVQKLGGIYPVEAFAGPIFTRGKIVAILYGDNLPEQKRIGNTAGLEIFLSHAGLAMDKAFLERMLRGKG